MKRFHLALSVADIEQSVEEYSARLGQAPELVIPDQYALWRTETLNVSIRKTGSEAAGALRHLGWESDDVEAFVSEADCNCVVWEQFSAEQQADEIRQIWPEVSYAPKRKP